jgi:AcrR family transcriptional regulator
MPKAERRRTRSEQVESNRTAVLATARQVFTERGYLAATLEQIADAAGFSKGVVYSQFGSKADLFLAVLEQRIDERAVAHERILEGLPSATDAFTMLGEMSTSTSRRNAAWALAVIEFRTVAARDHVLLQRYRSLHEVTVSRLADLLEALFERSGASPSIPVRVLAEAALALDTGATLESLVRRVPFDGATAAALGRRLILGADVTTLEAAR